MEEARDEFLRSSHMSFDNWVESGVDLPVIDLSLRYRQSLTMGATALVKTWLEPRRGVRLTWQYDIQNAATGQSCVEGTVVLVPVHSQTRKVLRRLPDQMQSALDTVGSTGSIMQRWDENTRK